MSADGWPIASFPNNFSCLYPFSIVCILVRAQAFACNAVKQANDRCKQYRSEVQMAQRVYALVVWILFHEGEERADVRHYTRSQLVYWRLVTSETFFSLVSIIKWGFSLVQRPIRPKTSLVGCISIWKTFQRVVNCPSVIISYGSEIRLIYQNKMRQGRLYDYVVTFIFVVG